MACPGRPGMKPWLIGLLLANLVLFAWFRGWMAPYGGDGRDPARLERQTSADRIRVVPSQNKQSLTSEIPKTDTGSKADILRQTGTDATGDAASSAGPMAAVRGALCAELGPLAEADAVRLQVALDTVIPDLDIRMLRPQGADAWWLLMAPTGGDGRRRLDELRAKGIRGETVAVIREGAWKGAVVLGRFRAEADAQAMQRSMLERGVAGSRIVPRGAPPARLVLQVMPMSDALESELTRQAESLSELSPRACPTPAAGKG